MKISSAYYLVGGTNSDNFPDSDLPEFFLCGRSNVGKSTFINTIFENSKLAKTSSKPGKTQVLNWFIINEQFSIVDAPGYGYAKVSKKQREEFGKMIEEYLVNRPNLKAVIMLIDFRHKPSEDDVIMSQFLDYYDIPVTYILTKEDKVKRNDRKKNLDLIKKTLNVDESVLIPFSSESKINIDKVFETFEKHL
ncbi:ribosome biogenesis GTP-binding protein YihA/YsxC [Mycoplasma sp. P36-A1]|uniref:ribosome biogenesis GTP-binding protein YihA/YsxC n=1 Tax=Mycoplasma sp. P36-A1 TaxID=3252900 RepID=UPI003C2B16FF